MKNEKIISKLLYLIEYFSNHNKPDLTFYLINNYFDFSPVKNP